MLFNSCEFWIFFPIVTLLYFALPVKFRNLWLLFTSCYFYMCWNPIYIILMIIIIGITYFSGLFLSCINSGKKRIGVLCIGIGACLGILFFYKYYNFFMDIINNLKNIVGITQTNKKLDIILPVGISFYTFQGIGYVVDVYRDKTKCEKNIILYALFISYFPQLVAGPIERSDNMLRQFKEKKEFDYDRVKSGLLLIAWGMFMKLTISDRLAVVVDQVFADYNSYSGLQLLVAAVFFGIQIYCDFAGYSNIAIGAARVMGFSLMKNFKQPYLATSVNEFWKRWHISLTSWFRDYLYISIGGNRKGKIRKNINLIVVFLVSGLWHGAGWNYIVWGGVNGIYQVVGRSTHDTRKRLKQKLGINDKNVFVSLIRCLLTFILIDFTWIFFRADSVSSAIGYLKKMFTSNNINTTFYNMGLDRWEFLFALLLIVILFFIEYLQYYKSLGSQFFDKAQLLWKYRWVIYCIYIFFMVVELCGKFGAEANQFIYFQF